MCRAVDVGNGLSRMRDASFPMGFDMRGFSGEPGVASDGGCRRGMDRLRRFDKRVAKTGAACIEQMVFTSFCRGLIDPLGC